MAQEKVPAEELAEARKMWAEHVRGVAREPRDPLEPMYAPSSLLTLDLTLLSLQSSCAGGEEHSDNECPAVCEQRSSSWKHHWLRS